MEYDDPSKSSTFATLKEAFDKGLGEMSGKEVLWGSPTLHLLTGGLHPGDLAVLAGFPRTAKTAFCIHTAIRVARAGKTVGYLSLDSDLSRIGLRFYGALTGCDLCAVLQGRLDGKSFRQSLDGPPIPPDLPLYLDDRAISGVPGIREACMALKESKGLDLVLVDSLRPLSGDLGNMGSRKEGLVDLILPLKLLAQDLACPVLAALPLADEIGSEGPGLAVTVPVVWESGLPEAAIDLLLAVDLERAREYSSKPDTVKVAILKNRYGSCSWYKTGFARKSLSLTGPEEPYHPEVSYGRSGR